MYNDYEDLGSIYEDRLREAERHNAHQKLVESALAYQRANGKETVGLLGQLAQRLHLKAQPTNTQDARRVPAV